MKSCYLWIFGGLALFVSMPTSAAENASAFNQSALTEMRKTLRPYWSNTESGGIFLSTQANEDNAAETYRFAVKNYPKIRAVDKDKAAEQLAEAMSETVGHFFNKATLKPGAFKIENYHRDYARQGKIRLSAFDKTMITVPSAEQFSFTVTDAHIKLIRRMNTRESQNTVYAMDVKRPYGDMTYYYIDIADALGETATKDASGRAIFSKPQEARYEQLHGEMLYAVQAFWQYAELP
jgi:hypothetical protein